MQNNTRVIYVKVAGVTFEGRQEYLKALLGDEPVKIVPEPDNKFDPNALAVHIAVNGSVLHCGYIPKDLAAEIAPLLDGEDIMASIDSVWGGGGYNWGLKLRVEIPTDDAPF